MRGIAALVTVADHTLFGFMPKYFGVGPEHTGSRLQGSPFFIFFNGSSAVAIFFVLSGYVLTRRYCASGDIRILLKGAVKRWPRLMGPVLVTVLVSYALFFFHLYYFEDAGAASGSVWLTKFGGAFYQVGAPDASRGSIHLRDAFLQGLFGVFFRGDWLFDGVLWTMRPEIVGSFLVFGAAPILLEAHKHSRFLTIGLVAVIIALLYTSFPQVAAFPIGLGLAIFLPHRRSLSPIVAYPALLASIYLLGYPAEAVGLYSGFGFLVSLQMPFSYPQIVGAAILISVIETFPPIRKPLSGRFSVFLGELSFPVYLLHMLAICSIGSKVYLMAGAAPAIAVVFAVSILASLPLIGFNIWWVGRVNRFADLLIRPRNMAASDSARAPDSGIVAVAPRPDQRAS